MRFMWCADEAGYAHNSRGRMHVFLLGKGVDHINGNRLDNRRGNIRRASQAQNSRNKGKQANNTSGFKGVYYDRITKRWIAAIGVNRKSVWLGRHDTAEGAAAAYDRAARELHGEFAYLNFGAPQ